MVSVFNTSVTNVPLVLIESCLSPFDDRVGDGQRDVYTTHWVLFYETGDSTTFASTTREVQSDFILCLSLRRSTTCRKV